MEFDLGRKVNRILQTQTFRNNSFRMRLEMVILIKL